MSPKKETKKDREPEIPRFGYSLRDYAEEQLARTKERSSGIEGQTPEQTIHELQVHQIELEIQAEELRRAHLELEESRDKYLDLYDFAPVGYLTLSDKALVEEANLTASLLLGIVRRKLIHARFRKCIVPKDQDTWDRHFMEVLRTGEKASFDLELLHNSGSAFPARLDCIRIERKEAGMAVRIAISDITRQREAEASIRESEERFWHLFSEIPLPYQSLDEEGRLLEVSPRWLETLGYARGEVIGRKLFDFVAPEDRQMVREIFATFVKTGAVDNVEFRVQKKDRSELFVMYSGRIGHNPDGSFRQTYCTLVDITERKRTEDALRISNKKLSLLSSITRHDINNQLLTLNGFLELLHRDIRDPAAEKMFTAIAKASNRIAAMIRFTKEYEQVGVHTPVWQDCHTLAGSAAKHAANGNIVFVNDLAPGTEVFADPLLPRVWSNLFDNATRHGGKITTIRISAEDRRGSLVVVFEDDGEGVPADLKEQIFDRGFGKNTGLGLTLVREILDITGITITETGEPGKGARFEILIPGGKYRFSRRDSPARDVP